MRKLYVIGYKKQCRRPGWSTNRNVGLGWKCRNTQLINGIIVINLEVIDIGGNYRRTFYEKLKVYRDCYVFLSKHI